MKSRPGGAEPPTGAGRAVGVDGGITLGPGGDGLGDDGAGGLAVANPAPNPTTTAPNALSASHTGHRPLPIHKF
jgi:hypothetical protein